MVTARIKNKSFGNIRVKFIACENQQEDIFSLKQRDNQIILEGKNIDTLRKFLNEKLDRE